MVVAVRMPFERGAAMRPHSWILLLPILAVASVVSVGVHAQSPTPADGTGSSTWDACAPMRRAEQRPLHSPLLAAQWSFSLPESVLQKTFLQQGSTGRLKKVLQRLLAGQAVHVGVLGGSVTIAVQDAEHGGYFGRIVAWLKEAFPKASITARNGAVSASTTMYMEHQLGSRLDRGVDLVFIEYAVNALFNSTTLFYADVASYERMLRLVLSGEYAAPAKAQDGAAALLVHMWRCCRFDGANYTLLNFHQHAGDHLNILSQYYSVPTVSVRNGLYHAYRSGQGIFSDISQEYPPDHVHSMTHPNALGHKYMADIVIYAIYMVLAQLEQRGITQGDCEMMEEPLPPPLVAEDTAQVVLGAWHATALSRVVVHSEGWKPLFAGGKFGYETKTAGSQLRLKVDTRVSDDVKARLRAQAEQDSHRLGHVIPEVVPEPRVVLYLGMLRSYEHMGHVRVRCVRGCTCAAVLLDTNQGFLYEEVGRSVSVTHPYPVPLSSGGAECEVELTADERTSSGEHKLSLRGMAVLAHMDRRGDVGS